MYHIPSYMSLSCFATSYSHGYSNTLQANNFQDSWILISMDVDKNINKKTIS